MDCSLIAYLPASIYSSNCNNTLNAPQAVEAGVSGHFIALEIVLLL
jgi:hypothetical protein